MAVQPVMTNSIQQQLIDAGIVPENCTRVIIDIGLDEILKVYYEAYGDKRILDLDLMSALKDVEVFKIEPALKISHKEVGPIIRPIKIRQPVRFRPIKE